MFKLIVLTAFRRSFQLSMETLLSRFRNWGENAQSIEKGLELDKKASNNLKI